MSLSMSAQAKARWRFARCVWRADPRARQHQGDDAARQQRAGVPGGGAGGRRAHARRGRRRTRGSAAVLSGRYVGDAALGDWLERVAGLGSGWPPERLKLRQTTGLLIVPRFQPWVGNFRPCAASCLRACAAACLSAASIRACSPVAWDACLDFKGRWAEAEAIFQSFSQKCAAMFRMQWFPNDRSHDQAPTSDQTAANTARTDCSGCVGSGDECHLPECCARLASRGVPPVEPPDRRWAASRRTRPPDNRWLCGRAGTSRSCGSTACSRKRSCRPIVPTHANAAAVDLPAPFGPAMTTTVGFLGGELAFMSDESTGVCRLGRPSANSRRGPPGGPLTSRCGRASSVWRPPFVMPKSPGSLAHGRQTCRERFHGLHDRRRTKRRPNTRHPAGRRSLLAGTHSVP